MNLLEAIEWCKEHPKKKIRHSVYSKYSIFCEENRAVCIKDQKQTYSGEIWNLPLDGWEKPQPVIISQDEFSEILIHGEHVEAHTYNRLINWYEYYFNEDGTLKS